ncbi:MAG: hypothetical protein ACYTGL_04175 [Planctomycetota bacterium]
MAAAFHTTPRARLTHPHMKMRTPDGGTREWTGLLFALIAILLVILLLTLAAAMATLNVPGIPFEPVWPYWPVV